jgi:hypothetical protein
MKYFFYLFLLFILLKNSMQAQYWNTIGNSGANLKLGLNNNMPLVFITNDIERMRLTQDEGRLGVGLQVPQSTLHIHSTALENPIGNGTPGGPLLKLSPFHYNALQITNGLTGIAKEDGIHIGVKDNDGFVNLKENGKLIFYTANGIRMSINNTGEVGIGTSNFVAKLNVASINQNGLALTTVGNASYAIYAKINNSATNGIRIDNGINTVYKITGNGEIRSGNYNNTFNTGNAAGQSLNWGTSYIGFNTYRQSNTWLFGSDGANNGGSIIWGNVAGDIYFAGINSTGAAQKDLPDAQVFPSKTHMVIKGDGNVGIGTNNTNGFKLNVCGTIRANELNIEDNNWCDFVFYPDYKLIGLDERKTYLQTQQHLPYIKSEKEIITQGANVSEVIKGLLQNVEELNLYIIQLHERIIELENK